MDRTALLEADKDFLIMGGNKHTYKWVNRKTSDRERFLSKIKIDTNTGCWEWQKGKNKQGYGRFCVNDSHIYAHRFAYQDYIGKIPEDILVCHHCDNPSCANPSHLFLGTYSDNFKDARDKGRKPRTEHPSASSYALGCRCEGCKNAERNRCNKYCLNNKEKINNARKKYRLENKDMLKAKRHERYLKTGK